MIERGTVLLAEDDADDVLLTQIAFQKARLANPLQVVRDGEEAIDYLKGEGKFADREKFPFPILLLLDLKMPRVDGIDVLRQIKGDATTKSIPVVVLTSSAEDRDVIDSYQLGVNSYIVKPVDFDQFFEVVSTLGFYWAVMNKVPPLHRE